MKIVLIDNNNVSEVYYSSEALKKIAILNKALIETYPECAEISKKIDEVIKNEVGS